MTMDAGDASAVVARLYLAVKQAPRNHLNQTANLVIPLEQLHDIEWCLAFAAFRLSMEHLNEKVSKP